MKKFLDEKEIVKETLIILVSSIFILPTIFVLSEGAFLCISLLSFTIFCLAFIPFLFYAILMASDKENRSKIKKRYLLCGCVAKWSFWIVFWFMIILVLLSAAQQ